MLSSDLSIPSERGVTLTAFDLHARLEEASDPSPLMSGIGSVSWRSTAAITDSALIPASGAGTFAAGTIATHYAEN